MVCANGFHDGRANECQQIGGSSKQSANGYGRAQISELPYRKNAVAHQQLFRLLMCFDGISTSQLIYILQQYSHIFYFTLCVCVRCYCVGE